MIHVRGWCALRDSACMVVFTLQLPRRRHAWALSAAEGRAGLIQDGSYRAIETQFLHNLAQALLLLRLDLSRLVSFLLISSHTVSCRVRSSHPASP